MSQKRNKEIFRNGTYRNTSPFAQQRDRMGSVGIIKKILFQPTPDAIPSGDIPVFPLNRNTLETQRNVNETHIYRLGHSTILMKFEDGYWLTDPVFSNRVSPSRIVGPKRFHQPPISVADLPNLKAVVISHNHYDHLDKSTIKRLKDKVEQFITTRGVAKYLLQWGVESARITELGWWQSHVHGETKVTATPSQHFSGRGLFDANKSLWASFVFQHSGKAIFFGSDSGYFDGFKEIGAHFDRFEITMLETGAYSSAWPDMHMTPEQTLQACKDLGGRVLMSIHNSTFKLSFHPWKEPLERISKLAIQENLPLLTPQIGARVVLGQDIIPTPWWQNA